MSKRNIRHAIKEAFKQFRQARVREPRQQEGREFFPPARKWEISWNKAKRAFELVSDLVERGYYTATVELSFYIMERSVEAWMLKKGKSETFRSKHGLVFNLASEEGLFDKKIGEQLALLWNRYRGEQYYRYLIATPQLAESISELSFLIHNLVKEKL